MAVQNVHEVDGLDGRLIELFARQPWIGVLEASRQLGVARGTVQARLDKLTDRGVITGYGPDVDLAAIGYGVLAFTTIDVVQGRTAETVAALSAIPEVLEVHTIAGQGDMLVRLAARSNEHLMDVLNTILASDHVARTSTAIALAEPIGYRTLPLVLEASGSQSS